MTDTYPRRNLPEPAIPWGRVVEAQQDEIFSSLQQIDSSSRGLGRTTASELESLARQLREVPVASTFASREEGWGLSTAWSSLGSLEIPARPGWSARVLLRWDVQGISTPGPDGGYMVTRALYSGGLAGSGERWVGWGRDYVAIADIHASSSSDVFHVDSNVTVTIQGRATANGLIVADYRNRVDLSAIVVYA